MRWNRSLFLLPFLAGCAATANQPSDFANQPFDLATAKVVDLTYAFDAKTLYWPNAPSGFELEQLARGQTQGGYFYSANRFTAPEHGGTHLDAPIHFFEKGLTVDNIPARQLVAPAVVIDVTARASANRDYRLTADDLRAWEAANGKIPSGTIVLLRTGWGKRYGDRKAYFGDDTPGATDKLHFPSYGPEAAEILVKERHAGALGVDTPSIDYGQSGYFKVHQIAAAGGVPGLENVANLESLPIRGSWVVAMPMKIGGGSGAPLRIIALLPTAGATR